jgi:hypothetical protein
MVDAMVKSVFVAVILMQKGAVGRHACIMATFVFHRKATF